MQGGLLNIPLAVSAQEIVYHLPELRGGPPLHLTGPVLAGMYDGTIAMWDDPKIAMLNPGQALPHRAIHPVHRTDGSGDTSLFTQYLSLSTSSWDQSVHFGTAVHWPKNRKALEGTGNAGVIEIAADAAYSVAYIGISYAERAQAAGLDVAAIQNRNGAFMLPAVEAMAATAGARAKSAPEDGRLSMIYSPGKDAYPLVNFEYAIVKEQQSSQGTATALRDLLSWIVTPDQGNDASLLGTVHFAPLPDRVREIARRLIAGIEGPGS
jgi:phosphate transport system substrate-binding protein